MKINFSKHALEKLKDRTSKRLGIKKGDIIDTLKKPDIIDNSDYPIMIAIRGIKRNLSLCVVYKFVQEEIKIITFFPARRGRYESKILSRR